MRDFINHWNHSNTELGASGPMRLQGGYAVADMIADYSALEAAITAESGADNDTSVTIAARDMKKNAIRSRLIQFRAIVGGRLYGSIYARSLPILPRYTIAESKYLAAFDEMANLWTQINIAPPAGFTGPLTLVDGYSLADYNAELAGLRAAYLAAKNAAQNRSLTLERRDAMLGPARARMLQYRRIVAGVLASGSSLLRAIPALSRPPGATPKPVRASGVWDETAGHAVLAWTPSNNPHLARYSIRHSSGTAYRVKGATVIGSVASGVTTFSTDVGLASPGSIALFRVYVVLATGHERGSNVVKVRRP